MKKTGLMLLWFYFGMVWAPEPVDEPDEFYDARNSFENPIETKSPDEVNNPNASDTTSKAPSGSTSDPIPDNSPVTVTDNTVKAPVDSQNQEQDPVQVDDDDPYVEAHDPQWSDDYNNPGEYFLDALDGSTIPKIPQADLDQITSHLESLFPDSQDTMPAMLETAYSEIISERESGNLNVFVHDMTPSFEGMLAKGLPLQASIDLAVAIYELPSVLQPDMNVLVSYAQELNQAYINLGKQQQELYSLISEIHQKLNTLVEIQMVEGNPVQVLRSNVVLDDAQKNSVIGYQEAIDDCMSQIAQIQAQIIQVAQDVSSKLYQYQYSASPYIIAFLDSGLSEVDFLTVHGIGPSVPNALLEFQIRLLKNQCENALTYYYKNSQYVSKIQIMLDYLNKTYPEFLSNRQLFFIEEAPQGLRTFFASIQLLENIAKNMQKELSLFENILPHKDARSYAQSMVYVHAMQESVSSDQIAQMIKNLKNIRAQKNPESMIGLVNNVVQLLATIDAQRSELVSFGISSVSSSDLATIQADIQTIVHSNDSASNILDAMQSLQFQLETIKNAQASGLQKAYNQRAYSSAITQQIETIFSLKQALWSSITASVSDQLPIESLLEIQKRMIDLLHSDIAPTVLQEQLSQIQNDLQIMQQVVQDGAKIQSSSEIDSALLKKLQVRFGADLQPEVQALEELLKQVDEHKSNFANLYVNKKLEYLLTQNMTNEQVKSALIDLKNTVSSGLSQETNLYIARFRALDVAMQNNITRAMDAFETYAKDHAVTPEQMAYIKQMQKNVLENDGAGIQKAITWITDSITGGTVQEKATLIDSIKKIGDDLQVDSSSSLQTSFNTLVDQLIAVGAPADTTLMGLLALPAGFDVSVQNEARTFLQVIKEYYEQVYKDGGISESLFKPLRDTIESIIKEVGAVDIKAKVSSGVSGSGFKKYAPFVSPSDQAQLLKTSNAAGELQQQMDAYNNLQDDFAQQARSIKQQALKIFSDNQVSLSDYEKELSTFEASYQDIKKQHEEVMKTLQSLQDDYVSAITILEQARAKVAQNDPMYTQMSDQITLWTNQKERCIYLAQKYKDAFLYNEQTNVFYQSLDKVMQGNQFAIIYDAQQDTALQKINTLRLPISKLIGLSTVVAEQSEADDSECSKKMLELYNLLKELDENADKFKELYVHVKIIINKNSTSEDAPKNSTVDLSKEKIEFEALVKDFSKINDEIKMLGVNDLETSIACKILYHMVLDVERKVAESKTIQSTIESLFNFNK